MYARICTSFFFFQAEDGIRDGRVTGVQTCALPISESGKNLWQGNLKLAFGTAPVVYTVDGTEYVLATVGGAALTASEERSEERRVGKECRSRLGADQ